MTMQELVALLREGHQELTEVTQEIQKIYNQVQTTSDATVRDLEKYLADVRSKRMNATVELKTMLNELQTLRSFFHGHDYAEEMDRVERFIRAAKELRELRDSGVLDMLLDASIKLKEHDQ